MVLGMFSFNLPAYRFASPKNTIKKHAGNLFSVHNRRSFLQNTTLPAIVKHKYPDYPGATAWKVAWNFGLDHHFGHPT
jgi:hypothetical protein